MNIFIHLTTPYLFRNKPAVVKFIITGNKNTCSIKYIMPAKKIIFTIHLIF